MLAKVFRIDVTQCKHCKSHMAILAAITNRCEVARYIKDLGIDHDAPARAPPRYQEEPFEFGCAEDLYKGLAIEELESKTGEYQISLIPELQSLAGPLDPF